MTERQSRFHAGSMIKEAKYVWYGDFEDLIRETYDRPDYRMLDTLNEVHNDSIEIFTVSDEGDLDGDIDDITVEEWLAGETKTLPWGYTQTTPSVSQFANDLYQRGLIPAGFYCMNVSW